MPALDVRVKSKTGKGRFDFNPNASRRSHPEKKAEPLTDTIRTSPPANPNQNRQTGRFSALASDPFIVTKWTTTKEFRASRRGKVWNVSARGRRRRIWISPILAIKRFVFKYFLSLLQKTDNQPAVNAALRQQATINVQNQLLKLQTDRNYKNNNILSKGKNVELIERAQVTRADHKQTGSDRKAVVLFDQTPKTLQFTDYFSGLMSAQNRSKDLTEGIVGIRDRSVPSGSYRQLYADKNNDLQKQSQKDGSDSASKLPGIISQTTAKIRAKTNNDRTETTYRARSREGLERTGLNSGTNIYKSSDAFISSTTKISPSQTSNMKMAGRSSLEKGDFFFAGLGGLNVVKSNSLYNSPYTKKDMGTPLTVIMGAPKRLRRHGKMTGTSAAPLDE